VSPAASCPFCGQALLNQTAVNRLARKQASFEQQIWREAQLQAQANADAQIKTLQKRLERDYSAKVQQAVRGQTKQLAELKRQLETERKSQTRLVQQAVAKQLTSATEKERTRLEREYLKKEKMVNGAVKKLQEQNDELSRRVERLSAGDRGELNEDNIQAQLMSAFPEDNITKTRRGQRGADIFQEVCFRTDTGLVRAGLIVYECKDALAWRNDFIDQAKAASRTHRTPYVVLVSRCFPQNEKSLMVKDDVMIVDPARCVALAGIVRRMVIGSYRSGLLAGPQTQKTEALFRYISSTEFTQAFESLAEATDTLTGLLVKERQSHQKVWTEREHIYQEISDKIVQIDTRFKVILQGGPRKSPGRPIRHIATSA